MTTSYRHEDRNVRGSRAHSHLSVVRKGSRRTLASSWARGLLAIFVAQSACIGAIGEPENTERVADRPPPPGPTTPGDGTDPGGPPSSPPPGTEPPDSVPPTPAAFVRGPQRLRLLNGREYQATVRALLDISGSTTVTHADSGTGYDTGASQTLDENLLQALLADAERVAASYVGDGLLTRFPCFDRATPSNDCASNVIQTLAASLFRAKSADLSTTIDLYQALAEQHGPTSAMEGVLVRLLLSPRFLYRLEVGAANSVGVELTAAEQAELIAYAVTGAPPDATLSAAAETRLDEDTIRAQVRRLLATPQGRSRIVAFVQAWVRANILDEMASSPQFFPKLVAPGLGESLQAEFRELVERVVFEGDGRLSTLLLADEVRVDAFTAPLYGVDTSNGGSHRMPPTERRGLLMTASVMASHASQVVEGLDSPVQRGLLIKNQFLCEEIGLPSGIDVGEASRGLGVDAETFDSWTTREQFEALMEQEASCSGCHIQFMPFGFAFGNVDALGRVVQNKLGRPIDTAVDGVRLGGAARRFDDGVAMVETLAALPEVQACFVRNFVRYLVGASGTPFNDSLVAAALPDFTASDGSIPKLVEDVLAIPELYVRSAQ